MKRRLNWRRLHAGPRPKEMPDELILAEAAKVTADMLPEVAGYEPEAPDDPGDDDKYPDWDERNSRVISGPIGETPTFPGRRAENWHQARGFAREFADRQGVKLFKFWTVPGRWFARVGRKT